MEDIKNVVELKGVTKDYGDFKLDQVSFTVPEGSVCGFIGQNGAGKTTTIKLMLDVIKADQGEIRLFGENIEKDSAHLREDIGVVFDEMGFHEFMTGRDINIMMKNIYKNWDEEMFFDYLKRFSLPSRKQCGDFSRGMRMKLQIAVALSHHAKLLIMDEPTSGLDPIVRNEMLQIFREFVIEEDHTILLSSHITGDLEKLADEVVFINAGKIVLAGNKDDILEKHGLLKCKKSELEKISEPLIVNVQPGTFGVEVLVNDRKACEKLYSQMVIEPATLEDIMLFYVNKDSKNAGSRTVETD
ncbi:MAG: ABC transporter ATP-binding protein [Lachnospiraceae bacterium]|nr:ABC transporter ATP-binding protein [Lachnospiraceae bacterium]